MACNQKMVYRHDSYVTRKIPYTKMLIGMRMVELSKQPLSMAYRGKKRMYYWLGPTRLASLKELKKVEAYRTKGS